MPNTHPKRIGLFGGSFDPIHSGHLIMAQDACECMALDLVYFIPAGEAPLRANTPFAPAPDRLAMVARAIEDDPRFAASDTDIRREGISYSIDTIKAMKASHPDATLYWIAGADQAAQLSHWRRIDEIATLADFIFLERGETRFEDMKLPPQIRSHPARARRFEISSTEIRQRLKDGSPIKYFLPAAVIDYIKTQNLYL